MTFRGFVLAAAVTGVLVSQMAFADNDKNLVVALRGTAVAQQRTIPQTPQGSTTANCFDLALVDVAKNEVIGTATDCLSDFGPDAITGTTIFHFREGTLTTRGRTTVQPISSSALPSPSTHITGSIPVPNTNQVLSGTGKFRDKSATVRLSGAVNLMRLASHNEITFDCLFVIDLH